MYSYNNPINYYDPNGNIPGILGAIITFSLMIVAEFIIYRIVQTIVGVIGMVDLVKTNTKENEVVEHSPSSCKIFQPEYLHKLQMEKARRENEPSLFEWFLDLITPETKIKVRERKLPGRSLHQPQESDDSIEIDWNKCSQELIDKGINPDDPLFELYLLEGPDVLEQNQPRGDKSIRA